MSAQFRVECVPQQAPGQLRFRLFGSLFFGAVVHLDTAVRAVEDGPDAPEVVIDALQLVYLDTTGVEALRQLHKSVQQRGGTLTLEHLQPQPQTMIDRAGLIQS